MRVTQALRRGLWPWALLALAGCGAAPAPTAPHWARVRRGTFAQTRWVAGTIAPTARGAPHPNGPLTVALAIPPAARPAWHVGLPVTFTWDSHRYLGQVTAMSPTGQPVATFGDAPILPAGSTVAVQATLKTWPNVLMLPAAALTTQDGQPAVRTASGLVPVEVLAANPLTVAVAGKLAPGEGVLLPATAGAEALRPPAGLSP